VNHIIALDQIRDHPSHRRLVQLCAEDNPDTQQRDGYRGLVIEIAGGTPVGQRRHEPNAAPPAPRRSCCDGFTGYVD
jgi:hypothetical protein